MISHVLVYFTGENFPITFEQVDELDKFYFNESGTH